MNERRKKKLIEPRLQLRLGVFFFLAAAGSVLVQAIVLRNGLVEVALALGKDGPVLHAEIPGVLLRSSAITLALLIPVSLTMGIQWMFRIVGPVYRFRVYLGRALRNEATEPCRIRHTDELHPLLRRINALTAPLRQEEAAELYGDDGGYETRLQLKCASVFASVATAAVLVNLIVVNSTLRGLALKLPEEGFALNALIPDVSLTSFETTLLFSLPLTVAIGLGATYRLVRQLRDLRVYLDSALRSEAPPSRPRTAGPLEGLFELAARVVVLRRNPTPAEETIDALPVQRAA